MTQNQLFNVIAKMNDAAMLPKHLREYVYAVAEMAWIEAEREGRVSGLEEAKKLTEATA